MSANFARLAPAAQITAPPGMQTSGILLRSAEVILADSNIFFSLTSPVLDPKGIILSGGPSSVYDAGAPQLPEWVLESGLPVLGICYGLQLLARAHGGVVAHPALSRMPPTVRHPT